MNTTKIPEYPGTKEQKANLEDNWTVAPVETQCRRCDKPTTVEVRHEVTHEPPPGGPTFACGKPKPLKRVLTPPGKLPRKLCTACLKLSEGLGADVQFEGRTGSTYSTPVK